MCNFLSSIKNREEMKNTELYREIARGLRRELVQEQERLTDEAKQLEERMQLMDAVDGLLEENVMQRDVIDNLQQQLADEKQRMVDLETMMNEMSKLSAGMAKKASQDDFHKALRIYLNISKRKTVGKREAAKNVITDLMTSAKLELPDDIMELLEHLDDEQTEPKTVAVNGNYIEAHDNNELRING